MATIGGTLRNTNKDFEIKVSEAVNTLDDRASKI